MGATSNVNSMLSIFWKLLTAPFVIVISASSKPIVYSLNVIVIGIMSILVGFVSVDVISTVSCVTSITNSSLVPSTLIFPALSVAVTTTS